MSQAMPPPDPAASSSPPPPPLSASAPEEDTSISQLISVLAVVAAAASESEAEAEAAAGAAGGEKSSRSAEGAARTAASAGSSGSSAAAAAAAPSPPPPPPSSLSPVRVPNKRGVIGHRDPDLLGPQRLAGRPQQRPQLPRDQAPQLAVDAAGAAGGGDPQRGALRIVVPRRRGGLLGAVGGAALQVPQGLVPPGGRGSQGGDLEVDPPREREGSFGHRQGARRGAAAAASVGPAELVPGARLALPCPQQGLLGGLRVRDEGGADSEGRGVVDGRNC